VEIRRECCVAAADSLWSQAGLVLTFLSLATVGLGIADVFFSYVTFCTQDDYETSCSPAGGSNYGDVLTFTWVSAGIWGGILVRLALRWPPLKMICNDVLVVNVNCLSYVFNIMKSILLLRNVKNTTILEKKRLEVLSAHPMICLLFKTDDVIPGKQATKHYKQLVEC